MTSPPRCVSFDAATLWHELDGNPGAFLHIARLLQSVAATTLAELSYAVGASDSVAIGRHAHALKGSLMVYGAGDALARLAELASAADGGRADALTRFKHALQTMLSELDQCCQAITAADGNPTTALPRS